MIFLWLNLEEQGLSPNLRVEAISNPLIYEMAMDRYKIRGLLTKSISISSSFP